MRKTLSILLSLFSFCSLFAQTEQMGKEVVNDILKHRTMKYGEIRIVARLNDIYLEDFIKKLNENKGKIYDSKSKDDKDFIQLTEEELGYLVFSFRKQFNTILWKEEDFKEYKLLPFKDIVSYSKQDINNEFVVISNPLFIRKNEIALVFLTDSNMGHCKHSFDLAFYKKIKGVWRMWICVKSKIEKCS